MVRNLNASAGMSTGGEVYPVQLHNNVRVVSDCAGSTFCWVVTFRVQTHCRATRCPVVLSRRPIGFVRRLLLRLLTTLGAVGATQMLTQRSDVMVTSLVTLVTCSVFPALLLIFRYRKSKQRPPEGIQMPAAAVGPAAVVVPAAPDPGQPIVFLFIILSHVELCSCFSQ